MLECMLFKEWEKKQSLASKFKAPRGSTAEIMKLHFMKLPH